MPTEQDHDRPTPGPALPVTPIPGTPADPLSPDIYKASGEVEKSVSDILALYGPTLEGIFDIFNKSKQGAPHFFYDTGDYLSKLPSFSELAAYMLNNRHGVCYHYAALTYYLLRAAGYDACIIWGYRPADMAIHYWTMVKTDRGWYHFDPLHRQMLLTDAQKRSDDYTGGNGLIWQSGIWPESATESFS